METGYLLGAGANGIWITFHIGRLHPLFIQLNDFTVVCIKPVYLILHIRPLSIDSGTKSFSDIAVNFIHELHILIGSGKLLVRLIFVIIMHVLAIIAPRVTGHEIAQSAIFAFTVARLLLIRGSVGGK